MSKQSLTISHYNSLRPLILVIQIHVLSTPRHGARSGRLNIAQTKPTDHRLPVLKQVRGAGLRGAEGPWRMRSQPPSFLLGHNVMLGGCVWRNIQLPGNTDTSVLSEKLSITG